ncbi:MAG: prolipoprotein diacylglyceryl transferase [Phycisphaerae bacterium]|nr:prolipoprotein diacylglyceryl transferase [Phycisphaerae bacterium]
MWRCYGGVSDLPWAIRFPRHVDQDGHLVGSPALLSQVRAGLVSEAADYSLPVHPVQIYASMASMAVFVIMLMCWKKKLCRGRLMLLYIVLYAFCRFWIEFCRDNRVVAGGFTLAQIISVVLFWASLALALMLRFGLSRSRFAVGRRPCLMDD